MREILAPNALPTSPGYNSPTDRVILVPLRVFTCRMPEGCGCFVSLLTFLSTMSLHKVVR